MDVDEALARVEARYHPIAPEAVLAAEVRRLRAEVIELERQRDVARRQRDVATEMFEALRKDPS